MADDRAAPVTYEEIRRCRAREWDARPHAFEVEHPEGPAYFHPLPTGRFLVARGSAQVPLRAYGAVAEFDAAYDRDARRRGIAWILRTGDGERIEEGWYDGEGHGNNCAEMGAVIGGLARARAGGSAASSSRPIAASRRMSSRTSTDLSSSASGSPPSEWKGSSSPSTRSWGRGARRTSRCAMSLGSPSRCSDSARPAGPNRGGATILVDMAGRRSSAEREFPSSKRRWAGKRHSLRSAAPPDLRNQPQRGP